MTLEARIRVLHSVFPTPLASLSPTPQATPLIGQTSFGQTQSSSEDKSGADIEDVAAESIQWERSWHTATSFLSDQLQNASIHLPSKCPVSVQEAIRYLRSPTSVGYRIRKKSQADDLLNWYRQSVQLKFLNERLPELKKLVVRSDHSAEHWSVFRGALLECKKTLLSPFSKFVLPFVSDEHGSMVESLESSYQALVNESLGGLAEDRLREHLIKAASSVLISDDSLQQNAADSMEGIESTSRHGDSSVITSTLSTLKEGGFSQTWLAGLTGVAFDAVLKAYVTSKFSGYWISPSRATINIEAWVTGPFQTLISVSLESITHPSPLKGMDIGYEQGQYISQWRERALHELGLLRLRQLFEIIVDWDNESQGGIEDLKHYIATPQGRQHVVSHFIDVISYRLLHPGASTTEILQIYIRIIRAFAVLDPRLVLLDRVARPVRRYLHDRDDTVRIIVSGLLADPDDPDPSPNTLVELATELHATENLIYSKEDDDLDWDDLNWVPNPPDADPEFQKSSGLDVIGNLLSLFGNKDAFVREYQNILGERLLGADTDFSTEIRVLELLKSRFGDGALQGCEVMLKDVFDSRRTDVLVKKESSMQQSEHKQPEFFAKILSRFFWPSLRTETFHVPPEVQAVQSRYADAFEEHKIQRKLAWLPALGQVTVELHFEHRTITELVTTWQASVIHAFQEPGNGSTISDKTAEELETELEMDGDLVSNALIFWVSKLVLYQPKPGFYRVLEDLPDERARDSAAGEQKASASIVAAAQSASAAAAASAASAVRSEEEMAEERMEIVWQYIIGMLTNQGPMPIQQMVMMLNIVVPGGFTHSIDELRAFLQRRVEDGKLEMAGANFRKPKS